MIRRLVRGYFSDNLVLLCFLMIIHSILILIGSMVIIFRYATDVQLKNCLFIFCRGPKQMVNYK